MLELRDGGDGVGSLQLESRGVASSMIVIVTWTNVHQKLMHFVSVIIVAPGLEETGERVWQ